MFIKLQLKKAILILTIITSTSLFAQVGIGTTSPDASSMLDITSSNSGVLLPRIALTGTGDTTTIVSPVTSLMIYNTATAGTAPNNVAPGFYFWNGTEWVPFTSGTTWREFLTDSLSDNVDDRIYHRGQVVIGFEHLGAFDGMLETDFDASSDVLLYTRGNIMVGDVPDTDPIGVGGIGNFGYKWNGWRSYWNGDKIGGQIMSDFQPSPGCGDTRVMDMVFSLDPGWRDCMGETDDPTEEVFRLTHDGDVVVAGLAGAGTATLEVDATGKLQRAGDGASGVTNIPFHDITFSGTLWTHPNTTISVSFDDANEIVTVTNNTGGYWDISISGSTSASIVRSVNHISDDVANASSLLLDLGADADGSFTIIARNENAQQGFTMQLSYWAATGGGVISYW